MRLCAFQLVLASGYYCAANDFVQVACIPCEFHLSEPISFNRENENQTVEVGTRRFILKCDVKGNPRPRVTWNLRGQVVRDGNDEKYHPSDEGLVIYNVSESDGGTYKCKATQREGFITALNLCVYAARAHGLEIIDGVQLDLEDEELLQHSCAQGRDLGFDGKSLIHPKQIAAANAAFAPDEAEGDKT